MEQLVLASLGGTEILRNVAASGVGYLPYEVDAPLREILDPQLGT